jgi:multiple sugar transport system permease protein
MVHVRCQRYVAPRSPRPAKIAENIHCSLFKIIGWLGLINSFWCLVLLYPTLAVPFCTWIMIGYFSSVPRELDEAALIDGAGYLQMLWKIFIPVAMPGIIAATIFAFTVSRGSFLYPLAYLYTSNQMVLTVGIAMSKSANVTIRLNSTVIAITLRSIGRVTKNSFCMALAPSVTRPMSGQTIKQSIDWAKGELEGLC